MTGDDESTFETSNLFLLQRNLFFRVLDLGL
jgi:hypothetical protein